MSDPQPGPVFPPVDRPGLALGCLGPSDSDDTLAAEPIFEARYRALLAQIPGIVFLISLDGRGGEAHVSPQIEIALGFSQQEWLEHPVRWYQQLHPAEKRRWSQDVAQMWLTGVPLRSVYRLLARDGRVVWFQCEARTVRRADGRPWFIQGVAFDITDFKKTEAALHAERNVLSAILDTVGALVVVLLPDGRIARFNRACEQITGRASTEVQGRLLSPLFMLAEDVAAFEASLVELRAGRPSGDYETTWPTPSGPRRIAWSSTVLTRSDGALEYVIATGTDITERLRLQRTVLEISNQEQRRIGQDLHDGIGQHLTGIAFMSKVLERRLTDLARPEAADAEKIVDLVNEAINKTRELARGLLPMMADHDGLVPALRQMASDVEDLFAIGCRLECADSIQPTDRQAATHLCYIAREAVNNAIRHGRAQQIVFDLSTDGRVGELAIRDDGSGFGELPAGRGMGLHIMRYRASMIGGTLHVDHARSGPTTVTCRFPLGEPPGALG